MFGSKRSKKLRKFLDENKSVLSVHNGVWLLGNNYDNLLVRHFENLSPEFWKERLSSLLRSLDQVPSKKEEFVNTLNAANKVFAAPEIPSGEYPKWVFKLENMPAALQNISDISRWIRTWQRMKRIEKIVAWVFALKNIDQKLTTLLKSRVPSSEPLNDELRQSLNMARNLSFRVKSLPLDLHRKSLWKHFELAFVELQVHYKELIAEQLRWSSLYNRILKIFEDETDLKSLSLLAFSVNRLQSFLNKPSECIYSIDDLEAALNNVKEALSEYRERAESPDSAIHEDLFPGGELVWGDLLTVPMPQGHYARLQEVLVRSDILVGRLCDRYQKVEQDLAENRANTIFVSMLQDSQKTLSDIKAWLKKTKSKPKGTKRFEQFLKGNLEPIQKLSIQYGANAGLVFGPAINAALWWFRKNSTLPSYLPRWVDDLLTEWLEEVPGNLAHIFSKGWDRNVFALFTRISGTRPYILEYMALVWDTLESSEKNRLWVTCPNGFKQKWLKKWFSKWLENELNHEEIESGLSVYSIEEKLTLLNWFLDEDPLPEIEVLKTISDQLGKRVNSTLHQYLMRSFESDISPEKEASLVNLASEIFGDSLDLTGTNSTFLCAILKTWKLNHSKLKFGNQVIADACWKLAVRGEIIDDLDLLFYEALPVKMIGSLRLKPSQWAILEPAFHNPEKLDFGRVVAFMSWSDLSIIPLKAWKYLLLTLKEKGEQHLKNISTRCRLLLESAKENGVEEISGLATLLYWAYCFFSNECSAKDVPDRVLQIKVEE